MITVMSNTNTEIKLTRVDHVSSAEDAATKLWDSVLEQAKRFGGAACLQTPQERNEDSYGVQWYYGPKQWADAYVVSDGADAIGFVATAENGDTVVFTDTN